MLAEARAEERKRRMLRKLNTNSKDVKQLQKKTTPSHNTMSFKFMTIPLILSPIPKFSLHSYKIGKIPTAYYIPNWINYEEEKKNA